MHLTRYAPLIFVIFLIFTPSLSVMATGVGVQFRREKMGFTGDIATWVY
jgi:hypothetical protein